MQSERLGIAEMLCDQSGQPNEMRFLYRTDITESICYDVVSGGRSRCMMSLA